MISTFKTAKIIGNVEEKYISLGTLEKDNLLLLEVKVIEESTPLDSQNLFAEILNKLKTSEKSLASLKKIITSFKDKKEIITLTAGFISDDILYLGNLGQGSAFLKRGNHVVTLLGKGESVSGVLKNGDLLMITSDDFNKSVPPERQKETILHDSFSHLPEKFEPLLLSSADPSGSIALIIQFSEAFAGRRIGPNLTNLSSLKEAIFSRLKLSSLLDKDEYPPSETEIKSKKTLATVAFILTLLLIASIFLSVTKGVSKEKLDNYNKNIDLVSHKLGEAQKLVDLNPLRARTLLDDSQAILVSLEKDFRKDSDQYKNIQKLLNDIKDKELAATRLFRLTNVPLFFDTTLLRSDGSGQALSIYEDTIAILDTKNKVVYRLGATNKQSDIVVGKDIVKEAKFITIHGNQVFILNRDGIISIDLENKSSKTVIKKDDSWGEVGGIVAFAGNIYILEKSHNQIGKYIKTDDGFSQKYNYIAQDLKPDFATTQNMSIDGSIWLVSGGEIIKFTQGRIDNFKPQGLLGNISSNSLIFTNDDNKKIYILDKDKSSIIVLSKDGNYDATYEWTELKKSTSFLASEEEKKIFVLIGSKIYAIELK